MPNGAWKPSDRPPSIKIIRFFGRDQNDTSWSNDMLTGNGGSGDPYDYSEIYSAIQQAIVKVNGLHPSFSYQFQGFSNERFADEKAGYPSQPISTSYQPRYARVYLHIGSGADNYQASDTNGDRAFTVARIPNIITQWSGSLLYYKEWFDTAEKRIARVQYVLMHEIAHAVGITHNSSSPGNVTDVHSGGSVMNGTMGQHMALGGSWDGNFTQNDIDAMNRIY